MWDPLTWGNCITNAIASFFANLVASALNPLLDLLGATLLTTPDPGSIPQIAVLWTNSWQLMLACYATLVMIAGIVVMAYQSLQTRYSIKDLAPRIGIGFLAGTLSLFITTKAIQLANALAQAILGGGVDTNTAADAIKTMLEGTQNGGIFLILIGIVLAVLVVALLVVYAARLLITVMLLAAAPLLLMLHALPHTEGIARWWWRAFGAALSIQLAQSLVLVTAMRVFFSNQGIALFSTDTNSGDQLLISMLITLALFYLLFRIPFWLLAASKISHGRSVIGSLARAYVMGRAFGLLGGQGGGGHKPRPASRPSNPYAHPRATSNGQYLLPLSGLTRGKSPKPAHQGYPTRRTTKNFGPRRAPGGVQLSLPLGDDWPENRPVLGHDGQYQLPLTVQRLTPPTPPQRGTPTLGTGGNRRRGGHQMPLPFDAYHGTRANRHGQYPLPLGGVHRVPKPIPPTPAPPARPATPAAGTRGTQMPLPFDPYHGVRANRDGQYPLPLDGVRRVPRAKPTPPPPTPPRPTPRVGRQLRLPLDLPRRPRRTPPPPTSGGKP